MRAGTERMLGTGRGSGRGGGAHRPGAHGPGSPPSLHAPAPATPYHPHAGGPALRPIPSILPLYYAPDVPGVFVRANARPSLPIIYSSCERPWPIHRPVSLVALLCAIMPGRYYYASRNRPVCVLKAFHQRGHHHFRHDFSLFVTHLYTCCCRYCIYMKYYYMHLIS